VTREPLSQHALLQKCILANTAATPTPSKTIPTKPSQPPTTTPTVTSRPTPIVKDTPEDWDPVGRTPPRPTIVAPPPTNRPPIIPTVATQQIPPALRQPPPPLPAVTTRAVDKSLWIYVSNTSLQNGKRGWRYNRDTWRDQLFGELGST
jgi:hypothetical protein